MAVHLGGTTYVNLQDGSSNNYTALNGSQHATWLFWVEPASVAGRPLWARQAPQFTFGTTVISSANRLRIAFSGTTGGSASNTWQSGSSDLVPTSTPTFIAVLFDGTQSTNATRLRTFINGVEVTAGGTFTNTMGSAIGTFTGGAAVMRFGMDTPGTDTAFTGCIGQCALWPATTLSSAQVAEAYAAGSATDLATTSLGQPVNYWRHLGNLTDTGSTGGFNGTQNGSNLDYTCANFPTAQNVTVSSIATLEAFGTPALSLSILASGIVSAEAFGSPRVFREPRVSLSNYKDTFRGGRKLYVASDQLLVDPDASTSFARQTIPATWTDSIVGGGVVTPSFAGLVLSSGFESGGTARITSTASIDAFDARLTAVRLRPLTSSNAIVDLLIFELYIDASTYARLALQYQPAVDTISARLTGSVVSGGHTSIGGSLVVDDTMLSLRIIRSGARVFLFSDETLVLSATAFSTSAGVLRMSVSNDSLATPIATRIERLDVSSHMLIGERLLSDKVDVSKRRLYGAVPAASLTEVGAKDIIVFGPWGSVSLPSGFEYTLPTGRTVGRTRTKSLRSYDDVTARDIAR